MRTMMINLNFLHDRGGIGRIIVKLLTMVGLLFLPELPMVSTDTIKFTSGQYGQFKFEVEVRVENNVTLRHFFARFDRRVDQLSYMKKTVLCQQTCWGDYTCDDHWDFFIDFFPQNSNRDAYLEIKKDEHEKKWKRVCEKFRVEDLKCPESCVSVMHINNPACIFLLFLLIVLIIVVVIGIANWLSQPKSAAIPVVGAVQPWQNQQQQSRQQWPPQQQQQSRQQWPPQQQQQPRQQWPPAQQPPAPPGPFSNPPTPARPNPQQSLQAPPTSSSTATSA